MFVEIISPDRKIFEGEATALSLPGMDGSLGILNRHAPLISSLKKGDVKLTHPSQGQMKFPINGGVIEVLNNKVIILAE